MVIWSHGAITAAAQEQLSLKAMGAEYKPLSVCVFMGPISFGSEWSRNFPAGSGDSFRREVTEGNKPAPWTSANCFFLALCYGAAIAYSLCKHEEGNTHYTTSTSLSQRRPLQLSGFPFPHYLRWPKL